MPKFIYPLVIALLFLSHTGPALAVEGGIVVEGQVFFRGLLPATDVHFVKADKDVCGKEVWIPAIQVDEANFGLRHVVVHVKNIPSWHGGAGVSTQILANDNCRFSPRMGAARVGDVLELQNKDPILHNTHVKVEQRTFLNVAQLADSRPIYKSLKRQGVHTFRCDKHTFMTGTLRVFAHPFFAVTDQSGRFRLPPLPVGTYRIVLWHHMLGSLEREVTVSGEGTVTLNVGYPESAVSR